MCSEVALLLLVRGRPLEALRTVAANPGGLRHQAYPIVMPMLRGLGYVMRGQPGAGTRGT